MKIDFHSHVKLAKRVDFDINFFDEVVVNAREAGLDAIAMTEHYNTKNFHEIYEQLDAKYPYEGNYYNVDGFKVFSGMEVDVKETGHILVIGHRNDVLTLRGQLEPHLRTEDFIDLHSLFELINRDRMLVIGAHPLRPSTPLHHLDSDILKQFDAFDLNGKDMHEHGIESMQERVLDFATQYDVPVVLGSDSHHPIHIGAVHNIFENEATTAVEIKAMIQNKSYTRRISPVLHTKIAAASIVKKKIKESLSI